MLIFHAAKYCKRGKRSSSLSVSGALRYGFVFTVGLSNCHIYKHGDDFVQ